MGGAIGIAIFNALNPGATLNSSGSSAAGSADAASSGSSADTATSPQIDPKDVGGKTADEIEKLAGEKGLQPKGPDPKGGRGAYADPVTGGQRILIHPGANGGGHAHVNNEKGERLDMQGNVVKPESPEAHLPLKDK